MRFVIVLLAGLAAVVASVAAAGTVNTVRVVIDHEGLQREALVDIGPNARNAPMLIALHGGLAGPMTIRRRARVTIANEGWIVAWPSAVDDWNDGRTDTEGAPYDGADDIGFLRKLVAELAFRGLADPNRVYFAGPSIGGVMVLNLICQAPDLVAGAAVAIASFPDGYVCPDGPPKPVLYIHGTEDDLMPPNGGRIGGWSLLVRDRGWVGPVRDAVARLAARNGCQDFEEQQLPDVVEEDDSTVLRRDYQGCEAPLTHFIVEGGGHTWPGSAPSRLGRSIVGNTNQDISATREIEAFFRALAAQ